MGVGGSGGGGGGVGLGVELGKGQHRAGWMVRDKSGSCHDVMMIMISPMPMSDAI